MGLFYTYHNRSSSTHLPATIRFGLPGAAADVVSTGVGVLPPPVTVDISLSLRGTTGRALLISKSLISICCLQIQLLTLQLFPFVVSKFTILNKTASGENSIRKTLRFYIRKTLRADQPRPSISAQVEYAYRCSHILLVNLENGQIC